MRRLHGSLLVFALAVPTLDACRSADRTPELSGLLQQIVSGGPGDASEAVGADVRAFYAHREYRPAWVEDEYPVEDAGDALAVLNSAVEHGLAGDDYGKDKILEMHAALNALDKDAPTRLELLAAFETRVTASLLTLGRDVALGRIKPSIVASTWKAQRVPPDLAGSLAKAVQGHTLNTWLNAVRPPHPEYAALRKAYADLRAQRERGGWPLVPAGTLRRGSSDSAVVALRQRLAAAGMLTGDAAASDAALFDEEVERAVKGFQELHGISATGRVDTITREAMNVSVDDRLEQVAINLDRWRWMPNDLGARHLFVNIPQFHLLAREHGRTVMDIRVVVGKPGNETPVFSDELETVVFSPYWYIPDSIKKEETAPAAMLDPEYLERNNIEVLRGSQSVDVNTIDWSDPADLQELAFRQRPGARNALGQVKFLFPNEFDVYLHDTPADSLFERRGRAFSHGCVRVEDPTALAIYILRGDAQWDKPRIVKAMHAGDEQHVKLAEKIAVHLAYFTAWVDEKGGLHFRPDIYGYDETHGSRLLRGS